MENNVERDQSRNNIFNSKSLWYGTTEYSLHMTLRALIISLEEVGGGVQKK